MPSATAYRRAPLVDAAFVPLSDAAVHADGLLSELTDHALRLVDLNRMSAMDAILATKLGGYTQTPPVPDVEAAASQLPDEPRAFIETVRAASMIAAMSRDKDAMLRVLAAMRTLLEKLPRMSEEALFGIGADALRVAVDLYRRTGQRFLLELMENLRARLPDVSGVMHMFPFQQEFQPEKGNHNAQEKEYYDRMQRFATGKLTADALAMTALLAQYSGSGRDAAAAKTGLAALNRYHGMPSGAFAADPYLAGRDPARAAELSAVSAEAEACLDALCMDGEPLMAEKLEMLLHNVLPDLLTEKGLRTLAPTNRLADDDSCEATETPEPEDVSALLRALYAIRRSVWLSRDDETIAYMLPVSGGCLTRLGGVPVRFTAKVSGVLEQEIKIRVECRQNVSCTLRLCAERSDQRQRRQTSGGAGRHDQCAPRLCKRRCDHPPFRSRAPHGNRLSRQRERVCGREAHGAGSAGCECWLALCGHAFADGDYRGGKRRALRAHHGMRGAPVAREGWLYPASAAGCARRPRL